MDLKLNKIVNDIHLKTGIRIDVYNIIGDLLTSASDDGVEYRYVPHALTDFSQGLLVDEEENLTYFLINSLSNTYIGVMSGADEVAKNYAYMVSSLIENAMLHSDDNLSRTDTLKSLLLSECTRAQIEKFMSKYLIPSCSLFVLAISCENERMGEVFNFLSSYSENEQDIPILMDDSMIAYLSFQAGDQEYQSSLDFAEHLYNSLNEETAIKVNIGVGSMAKTLYDTAGCYQQALSALRMGIQSGSKNHVHSYKEYIMIKMIEDIPKAELQTYLDILLDTSAQDILTDSEMMNTAEEFLNNSLNISETSRHLYMHRNTLMYRLDKIERSMGLNIRRFSDAVTFRIIMVLYKYLKH